MPRALVIACLCLLPAVAASQDCNRTALDLFDASRRSRTALGDMLKAAELFDAAMRRYDEEMPSDPGFLGAAFVFETSELGTLPVCVPDGTEELTLSRLSRAALGRWDSESGDYGLRLMYVTSGHDLSDVIYTETTDAMGEPVTEITSRPALGFEQSYFGARLILPRVDLTAGVIQVGGVRPGETGLRIEGAELSDDEPLRLHLRVGVPLLSGISADVVIGAGFEQLETAVLDLSLPLPHDLTGDIAAAWLNDESRAVLRLGLTDPWQIFSADVGFETSSAFFRHARLRGGWISDPLVQLDLAGAGIDGTLARFVSPYLCFGVEGELSRFSGRHFEDVTGQSGATGWAVHGTIITHLVVLPVRAEIQIGGGKNRVDLLEHAAAFADRGEFLAHGVVSLGW